MNSVPNFERLLKELRYLSGKTERELAEGMGYRSGYLSEARSRGSIPDKLFLKIQGEIERYNNMKNIAAEPEGIYETKMDRLIGIIESQQKMLAQQQDTIHNLVTKMPPERSRRSA